MTITYQNHSLSREEFCKIKSAEFAEQYPKENITPEVVDRMISACQHPERPWEEESSHDLDQAMENVCQCLESQPKELEVVPEGQWTPNSQEAAMIEVVRNSSLESGAFSKIREKFDLGEGMLQLTPRAGTVITPHDFAACIGVGWRMAESGKYLVASAIVALRAYNLYDNVLDQVAGMLRLNYSTLSNLERTAKRVPEEYRKALPFTIAQEIACAKYDADPEKNQSAINDLLKEAQVHGWSSDEAREAVRKRQGKPPRQSKKTEEYEFLVIHNGNHYLSEAYPPVEEGMEVINLKTKEYLHQTAEKVEFLPLEVRK